MFVDPLKAPVWQAVTGTALISSLVLWLVHRGTTTTTRQEEGGCKSGLSQAALGVASCCWEVLCSYISKPLPPKFGRSRHPQVMRGGVEGRRWKDLDFTIFSHMRHRLVMALFCETEAVVEGHEDCHHDTLPLYY